MQPLKFLLDFSQLLSSHLEGVAASVRSQFWEPSFTFGGQKLLMAMPFLVIDMEGDTLISHHLDAI